MPPGLGCFPVRRVDEFRDRVPARWLEHGGVMLPMFQAEAAWLMFEPLRGAQRTGPGYPHRIRVAAGKINAVNGEPWGDAVAAGSYLVAPPQPWLDGFCVEKGKIRQFVAMPLGMGLTVEAQVSGEEVHGGLQIDVHPMKAAEYEKRFPKRAPSILRAMGGARGMSVNTTYTSSYIGAVAASDDSQEMDYCRGVSADMGMGAGGLMTQDIHEDTYGLDVWEPEGSRVFVHLVNSFAWEAITGSAPPSSPATVEEYARHHFPWFSHYTEGQPVKEAPEVLKRIKSIRALGFQKGLNVLPSNASVEVPLDKIVRYQGLSQAASTSTVRDGSW